MYFFLIFNDAECWYCYIDGLTVSEHAAHISRMKRKESFTGLSAVCDCGIS